MDDKIIVSNRATLVAKYTGVGATKIEKAVRDLIAADAKRGIKSRLVYLDDARAMKTFHGSAVNDHTNARQNKQAIDAIFQSCKPGLPNDPGRYRRGAASGHDEPGLRRTRRSRQVRLR